MQNKLFTECQSSFIPGDSCVAQLLSVTNEVYKNFDWNPPAGMRRFFLLHGSLIFQLKSYGIGDDLLKLFINYFEDQKERVVSNGHASS